MNDKSMLDEPTQQAFVESVKSNYGSDYTVEPMEGHGTRIISLSFDINKEIPRRLIEHIFGHFDLNVVSKFIDEAEKRSSNEVRMMAQCSCFTVCSGGRCWTECYICYPPPVVYCFGPYPWC